MATKAQTIGFYMVRPHPQHRFGPSPNSTLGTNMDANVSTKQKSKLNLMRTAMRPLLQAGGGGEGTKLGVRR